MVAVDMEGRYITEMLEHSIKNFNPKDLDGKFLQMSGIHSLAHALHVEKIVRTIFMLLLQFSYFELSQLAVNTC